MAIYLFLDASTFSNFKLQEIFCLAFLRLDLIKDEKKPRNQRVSSQFDPIGAVFFF